MEEARKHRVDCRCLLSAPGNGRRDIRYQAGRVYCCLRACFQKIGLVEDEGGELKVRFFRVLSVFLSGISAVMMSGVQGCHHKRLVPDPDEFSHNPPAPIPEASHNPRCVGS